MRLTPATRLGPYEIIAPLGVGGMGEVYRARDPRLKRDIAIKVLPADVASSPDRLARFEREATTVAGLNHPNIVTLHSIEEVGGTRLITMELVEGRDLNALVIPGGLPLAQVLDLAIPVAEALVAAHEKGVVHRDLKPANVMMTREGRVKVLDFGLAKLTEAEPLLENTQAPTMASPISNPGQVVGTAPYMAPEQIRGQALDARSDLFSFGILMYELVSGRRPFAGGTLADLSSSILRDSPPPLSSLRSDLPADLERIIDRCLEKNPRERFQTALDVVNDLRRLRRMLERGAAPLPKPASSELRPVRVTRLIVLPFRTLAPDPATEFLAFSLPDAVAGALGGLRSLVVRSSMAASRFTGDALEPQRVGVEADVDVIVTGTLMSAGGEVRVATQLTDASSAALLWSHTAQASVDDLFRVQDDLTQHIVASLSLPLSSREQALLRRDVPANAEAYSCFLRGNQLSNDPKQWSAARDLYLQSVEADPDYAPAWARLGRIHHVMGKYLPAGTGDSLAQAEAAFGRALELNPDLTIAHKLFAQLEVDLGRAHDAMVRLVERAQTADPELLAGLVTACRYCGLLDASLGAHARAIELDPKVRTSVAHTWFLQRNHGRVADSKFAEAPYIVSLSLAEVGRGNAALAVLRDLESKTTTRFRDFMAAARTLIEGNTAESIAAVGRVVDSDFRDPEGLFYLSRHLAHLGETTLALELLDRVVAGGFFCFPAMARDPWLDPLRHEPAFATLLQQAESQHQRARVEFEQLGGDRILGTTA
jgi:eukaryotic-like serine/threonine-protein kinase